MSDIVLRFNSLISSNNGTTSATANTPVQISGGPTWPLTAVSASFKPSHHRLGITVTNNGTVNIYLGTTSSVSITSFLRLIAPGDDYPFPGNGGVPLWLVSGGVSQPFQMQEWQ